MLKRVGRLAFGSTVNAAINAGVYPLLAALYRPSDLGAFGVYFSATQLIATTIGFRFEQIVPLRRTTRGKVEVARSVLLLAGAVALLLALLVLVFPAEIRRLSSTELGYLWLLAPLNAFSVYALTLLFQILIADHRESAVAMTRNLKTLLSAALQLSLPLLLSPMAAWLVVGECAASVISFVVLYNGAKVQAAKRPSSAMKKVRHLKTLMLTNLDQPTWNLPQTFINSASGLVVITVITHKYGPAVSGAYFLMYRLLMLPSALFSSSYSQVFTQEASNALRKDGDFSRALWRLIAVQGSIGLAIVPALYVLAPRLFPLVLGHEWAVAGELAREFSPYVFMHLILSAAGNCTLVAQKQKPMLAVSIIQNLLFAAPFVVLPAYLGLGYAIRIMTFLSIPYMVGVLVWYVALAQGPRLQVAR